MVNQILLGVISRPSTLWVLLRILNGGSNPADASAADTLTSNLSEVSTSGTGYGRQSVTFSTGGGCTEAASGASSLLSLPQVTFTFSGTVTGVTHAGIATSTDSSGTLWWSAPLATTRNFAAGDSLKCTPTFLMEQGS